MRSWKSKYGEPISFYTGNIEDDYDDMDKLKPLENGLKRLAEPYFDKVILEAQQQGREVELLNAFTQFVRDFEAGNSQ